MYKMYASLPNQTLTEEVEKKKLLSKIQAGFGNGRGTINSIAILHYIV